MSMRNDEQQKAYDNGVYGLPNSNPYDTDFRAGQRSVGRSCAGDLQLPKADGNTNPLSLGKRGSGTANIVAWSTAGFLALVFYAQVVSNVDVSPEPQARLTTSPQQETISNAFTHVAIGGMRVQSAQPTQSGTFPTIYLERGDCVRDVGPTVMWNNGRMVQRVQIRGNTYIVYSDRLRTLRPGESCQ